MDCQSISTTSRSTGSHDDELFSSCCMTPLSDPFVEKITRSFFRCSNSPPPPPQRRCGILELSSQFNNHTIPSKRILLLSDDIMLPDLSCCSSRRRKRKKMSLTLNESSAFSSPQQQNPDDDDIQMTYPPLPPLIKLKPKLGRYDLYERGWKFVITCPGPATIFYGSRYHHTVPSSIYLWAAPFEIHCYIIWPNANRFRWMRMNPIRFIFLLFSTALFGWYISDNSERILSWFYATYNFTFGY